MTLNILYFIVINDYSLEFASKLHKHIFVQIVKCWDENSIY